MFAFFFFFIYFTFLVARGIKPTSTRYQVLSSSPPTRRGAGDGGRVCLMAEGPRDRTLFFCKIDGIEHIF